MPEFITNPELERLNDLVFWLRVTLESQRQFLVRELPDPEDPKRATFEIAMRENDTARHKASLIDEWVRTMITSPIPTIPEVGP